MKEYDVIGTKPVAKFFYQGNHSHPVRRTVLLISEDKDRLTGYEIRAGKHLSSVRKAKVKTYLKERIAKIGDYSRIRCLRRYADKKDSDTTLEMLGLVEAINNV